jgi:hypothetical protein
MFFDKVQILMAVAAGFREIQGIDARSLFGRNDYIVLAVTIGTAWHVFALPHLEMAVPFVDFDLLRMATSAVNLRQPFLMRNLLNTDMTRNALILAMNGALILRPVNEKGILYPRLIDSR